jgi:hypothetical protein
MSDYKKRYHPFRLGGWIYHNLSVSTDLELLGNGWKATSITGGLADARSL